MTRVLLVDDQEMIRLGLRAILDASSDFEVVGEAADGFAALELLSREAVDLVLMDIRMPGIDGVETTRRIRDTYSAEEVRIVVLTTFERDDTVFAALRAGADGFLGKGVGPSALIAGLAEVMAGGGTLSAAASAALIEHVVGEPRMPVDETIAARFAGLTPREHDVVVAIAQGKDNDGIARELFVSPFTVKTHASRAMLKVGARDRAQLVSLAYQGGLVPPLG